MNEYIQNGIQKRYPGGIWIDSKMLPFINRFVKRPAGCGGGYACAALADSEHPNVIIDIELIGEQGNVVLEPTIAYDELTYPSTNKGYNLIFLYEDAFVIPTGGGFAIITIER